MGTSDFEDTLRKAAKKSSWVEWLVKNNEAQKTLGFLKMSYSNLLPSERHKWAGRVSSGEADQIESTIYELVTIELLRRLELVPNYEPPVEGKKPDIRFCFSDREFLADVFVTHSPEKTVKRVGTVRRMKDAGDRAWKIQGDLEEKVGRYAGLGSPLVLFVFLGNHDALGIRHVEEALLGHYYAEGRFTKQEFLAHVKDGRPFPNGLFLNKIVDLPCPRNLSSVVACDWFDTLNREDPGKRLNCLVIHYWDAIQELPVAAFGEFPQIVWSSKGPDVWEWEYTTEDLLVAKLPLEGGIEFGVYTASNPW